MRGTRLLVMAMLVVIAATLLGACSAGGGDNGAGIDAASFQALVDEPKTVVLDVRTPQEYAAGHLPGSVNLDVNSPEFDSAIADLDPSATYALYCRSGNRSGVALERMVDAGFTDVRHLEGGIQAWQQAGGEIVLN